MVVGVVVRRCCAMCWCLRRGVVFVVVVFRARRDGGGCGGRGRGRGRGRVGGRSSCSSIASIGIARSSSIGSASSAARRTTTTTATAATTAAPAIVVIVVIKVVVVVIPSTSPTSPTSATATATATTAGGLSTAFLAAPELDLVLLLGEHLGHDAAEEAVCKEGKVVVALSAALHDGVDDGKDVGSTDDGLVAG